MTAVEVEAVKGTVLAAYRWQYIASGVQIPQFSNLLNGMITPAQGERIGAALAPIISRGVLYLLPARPSSGLTSDQRARLS
jgi:hypothetical protein